MRVEHRLENQHPNGSTVPRYAELTPDEREGVHRSVMRAFEESNEPWRHRDLLEPLYKDYKLPGREICTLLHEHAEYLVESGRNPDAEFAARSTTNRWIREHFRVRPGQYYQIDQDRRDEWLEDYWSNDDDGESDSTTPSASYSGQTCNICGDEIETTYRNHFPCPGSASDSAVAEGDR